MRSFNILFIIYVQNIFFNIVKSSSLIISSQMELCGPETEIHLTPNGESSAATISLPSTPVNEEFQQCKLHVNAPKTHVVYMQFTEANVLVRNKPKMQLNITTDHHPTCIMHVILPDSSAPFWKGDLCSNKPLPPVDLLPSEFKIIWNRPSNPQFMNTARKLVLTAVGQGIVCKENDQHTCMRIGRVPLLCVSNHLLCDGIYNCPKSSTKSDEDSSVCDDNPLIRTTWEQIAMEMIKKLKPPPPQDDQKQLPKKTTYSNWQELQTLKKFDTSSMIVEKETKTTDSISQMLAKYGPWGYLMLGLLICGTVLMFCGLWECCFKKQKDPIENNGLQTQPTAVLIINQGNDGQTNTPPNYDEVEPPPSYSALFPNAKPESSTQSCSDEQNTQNTQNNPDTGQNSVDV